LSDPRPVRIICREGEPTSATALDRVSARDAGRVIILAQPPGSPNEEVSDSLALQTLLVLRQLGSCAPVVIESRARLTEHPGGPEALFSHIDDNTIVLNWRRIVGRLSVVLANSPSGMSNVFYRLMNFADEEIHVADAEPLVGTTVYQASKKIENAIILGKLVF